MKKYYGVVDTKWGAFTIACTEHAVFKAGFFMMPSDFDYRETTPLLLEAEQQLGDYFAGKRKHFELPLLPEGTLFQKKVWSALVNIPFGETRSYRQIAEMIGQPTAARAVGMANNRNPLLIFIPCHRIIGHNRALTGYAVGLPVKRELLKLEGICVDEKTGKVF